MEAPYLNQPEKSLLKRTVRAFAWLVIALVVLIGALLALLFIYEDEVKAVVISELNKHLKAEVRIAPKDIDLTIIRTFPDCSIDFKNVLILEALPIKQKDTLLFAGRMNLHFNIKDLWNKNYRIHKIKIKNAVIKLQVTKQGQVNYLFWEEGKTKGTEPDNLAFDLNLLSLEAGRFQYKNKRELIRADAQVRSLELKGNFNPANFELNAKGKTFLRQLVKEKQVLLKEKNLDFTLQLTARQDRYQIGPSSISLNKLLLELEGFFTYKDSLTDLALRYNAPQLNITSILSLLPSKFKTNMEDYESSGNFYTNGSFNYTSSKNYKLISNFGIKNGSITYKRNATRVENIQVAGRLEYSNSLTSLDLRDITLNLNGDVLKGSCLLKDFSKPYVDLVAQGVIHLENVQAFLPLDTLSSLKGNMDISSHITGQWQDLRDQAFSKKVRLDLDVKINGLEAQFKGDTQVFAIESCSLIAVDREIEVKGLRLKRGSSDVLLNGKLPGIFNYLVDRKNTLVINGNLVSNLIRMEDFMVKYKASGGQGPLIPDNVRFKLNVAILELTYLKFNARAITGDLEIKHQKAIASDVKLETMDGEATIDAFADNSHNRLNLVLQSQLKGINISKLFFQLNNFGQATLQDKNLKGFASADIDFSGNWSNNLDPDYNSIQATASLIIERGELDDFKPLLSLSRFVAIKDLEHIRFSTLKSNIQIANQTITFPKTVVKNSALNISMWGSHRFNNEIDYHLQLLISELLAKKRRTTDDEFGPVQDDPENKRSAFILMTGTVDNPIIKYDRQGLKEKVKSDIKEEKQTIKRVLKDEFGFFKRDSSLKRNTKPAPAFELEKPGKEPPKKVLKPARKEDEEDF